MKLQILKLKIKVNFKILFLCGIVAEIVLALGVYVGFVFIPGIIEDQIWQTKILKENTDQWKMFMRAPFRFDFKVYVFNIENPEDILNGAKPVVKEVGPYIYKLQRWKNEVAWNYSTDEISFYEFERFDFDRNASGNLSEEDSVTVLNVPYNTLLTTAESISPGLLPFINSNLAAVFRENDGPFLKTKIKDFLFDGVEICKNGAKDAGLAASAICSQIKKKSENAKQMRVEKDGGILFSNFHFKNNSHLGYFTIKSGLTEKFDTGRLVYYENKTRVSVWKDTYSTCNKIGGLTSVFPAKLTKDMKFNFFSQEICRSITVGYSNEERVRNIDGYRFSALNTTFNGADGGECYCVNKTINLDGNYGCLFDGVTDLSTCQAKE